MATKHSCREIVRVLKFWVLWILSFLPLTLAITSNVSDHDLHIMNLLKKLNKPYVKSIQSPDGDIIDCVPFHLQPAFDDPLLKNHSIKMPYPEVFSKNNASNNKPLAQLWHTKGRCPEGTVSIRRTTKEDILRAESIQRFGKKAPGSFPNPDSPPAGQTNNLRHEYAMRRSPRGGPYFGTKANIGTWRPITENADEFSLAQVWLSAGSHGVDLNTIEAGWQVYKEEYEGDGSTILFVYWTRDSYRNTGCYNLKCNGFVQYTNAISLGSAISPTSTYGINQREITLYIYKEPISGNWWLTVDETPIGYWPSSIFTHLRDSATGVDWGGEVVNRATNGRHTTTEMGSGRFSRERQLKAAHFTNLEVVDESYSLETPVGLHSYVTNPTCYDLIAGNSDRLGEFFYYGGPGRNRNCP